MGETPYEEFPLTCKECGEENPESFPVCWNCHADLDRDSVPRATPRATQTATTDPTEAVAPAGEGAARASGLSLRETKVELAMVLLVLLVPGFAWRFSSVSEAVTLEDELFSVIYGLGELSLVLYLLWRGGGWPVVAGLGRARAAVEVGWSLLVFVLLYAVSIFINLLWDKIGVPLEVHDSAFWLPSSPGGWSLVLVSAIVAASFEELFFRAYLWHRLTRLTKRPVVALLLSSTVFMLSHDYGVLGSLEVFAIGMTLGLFYWMERSVWRLALGHALYNLVITAGFVLNP